MRKFYNIQKKNETDAELDIYGEITNGNKWLYDEFGVPATDQAEFIRELNAMGDIKNLTVYINSPGGDVYAAQTIHNVLKRHPANVTVMIDGIAASAACIVVCAGDAVRMPLNAQMMFHDVMAGLMGAYTAEELRDHADALDHVKNGVVAAYMTKSNRTEKELSKLMNGQNWLTAKECKAYGFVDEILYEKQSEIVNAGKFVIVNSIAHDFSQFEINPYAEPPPKNSDPTPQLEALSNQRKRFFDTRQKINE